jgi:hypothetical protein
MSDLAVLDPNNWYAQASLLVEVGFLAAGVWFAHNVLRTMRAFQEQVGAILKLSITGATGDRSRASATEPLPEVSPYWLAPSETRTAGLPERIESDPSRVAVARRKMVLWLQEPMSDRGMGPWRQIITWLRAPAGS